MNLYHALLRTHQATYVHTDGLLGHKLLLGRPTLLLRTTGKRTGIERTTALIYARDGDRYLVVASNGGSPLAPSWLVNLKAHPDCEIQVARHRIPATARVIPPADDHYPRYWGIVNAVNNDRYTAYQNATSRRIPVVELTRLSRNTAGNAPGGF
ncbi:nitroreductase/quinone reductase family protein [Amycolatopsis minnesotensis]|uniref:F420H(2)-dependent quinone reductase n=1 Tax=Amycolatopsis minnesotensis TaxID=337894 RepID=A0ABN2QR59_9PSEU